MGRIQKCLQALAALWQLLHELKALTNYRCWQGVGKAIGDHLHRAGHVEVREVAAIVPAAMSLPVAVSGRAARAPRRSCHMPTLRTLPVPDNNGKTSLPSSVPPGTAGGPPALP